MPTKLRETSEFSQGNSGTSGKLIRNRGTYTPSPKNDLRNKSVNLPYDENAQLLACKVVQIFFVKFLCGMLKYHTCGSVYIGNAMCARDSVFVPSQRYNA